MKKIHIAVGLLLTVSISSVFPFSASASNASDYVVVGQDGSVEVQSLTPAQAAGMSADSDIKFVSPDRPIQVSDASTDIVTGLDVPTGLAVGDAIPNRYIVQFTSKTASAVAAASLQDNVNAFFSNAINGFVAELSPEDVTNLESNPNVISIEQDRIVGIDADQASPTWGLDRVDQRFLPLNQNYSYATDGTGVSAYIIDTGVYSAHSEFIGRVRSGFTSINDGIGSEDCHGHGTHVGGTVAGTSYGVAKKATIIPVRVLSCSGRGTTSGVIAGIDWAVGHHVAGVPAVANMSLGGGFSSASNAAIARATADGITMVVAAGNNNGDACSVSPASAPSAITVAATSSNDARASFSNFGRCVDVFAPGVAITSATIGGPTRTASWSGTSMAAPHVAGVVALYLQSNSSALPASVTSVLLIASTQNLVVNAGPASPNRLIFSGSFVAQPPTTPSAPTIISAAPTNGVVTLTWQAPVSNGGAAITSYTVEYSTSNNGPWTSVSTASTSLAVTGLTNGTAYSFRVSAVNSIGTGTASPLVLSTPQIAAVPSAPRSLNGSVGRQTASLSWSAPVTAGGAPITDYIIDASTDAGVTWAVLPDAVSTALRASFTGLTAGLSYQFRVRAMNAGGSSAASNVVTLVPLSFNPPSAVRSLTASPRLLGAYVYWTSPMDLGGGTLQSYVLDYSVDGGATYSGITRVGAGIRAVTLTGLAGGVEHLMRVRAINEHGTSVEATIRVTPTPLVAPTAPRSLYVNVGFNTASLYWSTPANNGGTPITGYVAQYSIDSGTTWIRSSNIAATTRQFSWSGLPGGSTHQFRVTALNSVGESVASNVVAMMVPAPTVPSSVRNLSGFLSGSNAFLSWSTPLNSGGAALTGYRVEVSTNSGASWSVAANTTPAFRSASLPGLTGGVSYSYRVFAVNSVGSSATSNIVTLQPRLIGIPNPPASVSATVNNTSINVSWSAVSSNAAPVTDYVVEYSVNNSGIWTVWNDGVSASTTASLTGMTPDVSVSVRIKSVNSFGTSPASAVVTVTPRAAATAPSAPLNITATSGDTRVAVRWSAPTSDGGSAIISYTATSTPGGFTCVTATNACVVTGLTNGASYTFTVTARNSVGLSPSSEVSSAVTPVSSGIPAVSAMSWGLDRSDQRALPLDGLITRGGAGVGVSAYVIDTGVLASHSDFTGRVVAGYSAISDGRGSNDCHGHGTHVAGTVAGNTYGFATEASIVPVRVLDCYGSGTISGVVNGINWMINHHVAGVPAVANMSLGGGYDVVLNDAIARAVADGITMVVAAGNESTDACTKSPASAPEAITVGSTTNTDARSYFSNIGACVDIFAPGSSIISAGVSSTTSTAVMSGTSMAAPHVAGVAVLILGNSRTLTPAQVGSQLSADATLGVLSGINSSTANSLLFQRVNASNSNASIDDEEPVGRKTDLADRDSSNIDYGDDPAAPAPAPAPVAPAPVAPNLPAAPGNNPVNPPSAPSNPTPVVSAPGADSSTVASPIRTRASVKIFSIKRSGKNFRVAVSAPKGSVVALYKNGKLAAKGAKSTFSVKAGSGKLNKFHAVVIIDGTIVSSQSVSISVRAASRK